MSTVLPVFTRELRESWRGLLGWTVGLAAVCFLYLPLFPSFGGGGQMAELIKSLPKQLVDTIGYNQIGTGAGYTESTFYGLMGFLLTTIAAVGWGSQAIAGREESGRLELDLAHGIGRVQYAGEQALAIFVKLAWLGASSALIIWALNVPAKLDLNGAYLVGAAASLVGLALLHAYVGLLVGALTGRHAWALGAAAGVAVLGYVLQAVAKQSTDLEWLRNLSPYSWVYRQSPLMDGANLGMLALVWGVALACAVGAAVALRSRDVRG